MLIFWVSWVKKDIQLKKVDGKNSDFKHLGKFIFLCILDIQTDQLTAVLMFTFKHAYTLEIPIYYTFNYHYSDLIFY